LRFLQRRGRLLGGLAAALALGLFVAAAYGHDPAAPAPAGSVTLPATPVEHAAAQTLHLSAGTTGPQELSNPDGVSRFAAVLRPVAVHARPAASSKVVARLVTRTPEGTTNIVLLLERVDLHGSLWLRVRLPVLPNNTIGWVPRTAVGGYNIVRTHLVVDTERLRATLYRNGHPIFSAPVGVGKPGTPTPRGQFYIRNELTKYADAFYGPVAFGTSARSAVLTDWPAGGYIGIHGTNQPGLIPGRISHGCIRMRNSDILRLARLMPPGTPLTIR
ncbi:MAG: L,D-transpeptidase, partial [Acidobacteriota bacterium]|nr:L,D-transpeptidase [Acidobacteriota bacterium]